MERKKRMRFIKRMMAMALAVCMVMGIIPCPFNSRNVVYAASGIENKLEELKRTYPAGKYWHRVNGVNAVTDIQCSHPAADGYPANTVYTLNENATSGCGHLDYLGWQCISFAGQIFEDIFKERVPNYLGTRTDKENIMVGDYVRIKVGNGGHSFIVIARNGNILTAAECNRSAPCIIDWGKTWDISKVTVIGFYHAKNYDAVNGSPPTPSRVCGTPMSSGGSRVLPDGDYQIVTGTDSSKCLTIDSESTADGANAQLYPCIGYVYQVFHLEWLGTNQGYKITYKGVPLTVDGVDKRWSDQNVNLYRWYGDTGQMWAINDTGNGEYYTIQALCSGHYLNAGSPGDSTNVQISAENKSASQKWKFVRLGIPMSSGGSQVLPDGDYQIVTGTDSSKCLVIDRESTADGANAQLYPSIGYANQVFHLEWLGANQGYKITYKGVPLTVDGVEKRWPDQNVNLYRWYGDTGQMWAINDTGNGGYYTIQALCSGHYLNAGSPGNPANVQISTENRSASQKWKFIPYPNTIPVERLTLNKTSLTLKVAEQFSLTATVSPDNATDKTLTWESGNTSVAGVANGVVTAKAAGTATITVRSANGKTASCEVTVQEKDVPHVHEYGSDWKSDADKHWKECVYGEKTDEASHGFVWESDGNSQTGGRREVCTVCGCIGRTEAGTDGGDDKGDAEDGKKPTEPEKPAEPAKPVAPANPAPPASPAAPANPAPPASPAAPAIPVAPAKTPAPVKTTEPEAPKNLKKLLRLLTLMDWQDLMNRRSLLNPQDPQNRQELLNQLALLNQQDPQNQQNPFNQQELMDALELMESLNPSSVQELFGWQDLVRRRSLLPRQALVNRRNLPDWLDKMNRLDLIYRLGMLERLEMLERRNRMSQ